MTLVGSGRSSNYTTLPFITIIPCTSFRYSHCRAMLTSSIQALHSSYFHHLTNTLPLIVSFRALTLRSFMRAQLRHFVPLGPLLATTYNNQVRNEFTFGKAHTWLAWPCTGNISKHLSPLMYICIITFYLYRPTCNRVMSYLCSVARVYTHQSSA